MKIETSKISPWQVGARVVIAILFALPMLIRWIWQYREDYQKEEAQVASTSDSSRMAA
jgi:coproporphyrinogen III oxidase